MSIFSFLGGLFTTKLDEPYVNFTYGPSELSNPDIHIVPYGFYRSHFILLDTISYFSGFGNPEFTGDNLNQYIKYGEKRASELGRMGYLNVRVEKFPLPHGGKGKRNYYSINKKGREALNNFNHIF